MNNTVYTKAHMGRRLAAIAIDLFLSIMPPSVAFLTSYFMYGIIEQVISGSYSQFFFGDFVGPILMGIMGIFIGSTIISNLLKIKVFSNEYFKRLLGLCFLPVVSFVIKDSFYQGQSYGKKMMGLIVIDLETNQPCEMNTSLLRNFVYLFLFFLYGGVHLFEFKESANLKIMLLWIMPLFLIALLCVIIQHEGRRLGDFAAKTQVIEFAEYEKQKNAQIS